MRKILAPPLLVYSANLTSTLSSIRESFKYLLKDASKLFCLPLESNFFRVHFHLLKLKLCFYNLLCRFWVLAFRVLHKKEFMYIHVYMVKQLRFTLSDVYEEQVKIWWANINYFVLKSLSEKRNFFPQKLTINLACCAPTNQPSIHIASWKYETMYVWAYAM